MANHFLNYAVGTAAVSLLIGLMPVSAVRAASSQSPVADIAATVSSEIQQDQVQIVLSARVQDASAVLVHQQLNQKIDAAKLLLGQPKAVRISTGTVQTYPRYDQKGKITGWQGKADLVLQSNDVTAVAASADKVSTDLVLTDVHFSLSDQARRAEQGRLMESVAKAFRDKAESTARVFGYSDYHILRLNVADSDERPSFRSSVPVGAMASEATPKASLTLIPGVQSVSVTVSGQIELR